MKGVCLILALVVCASALTTVDKEWEEFKVKYEKTYSVEEDAHHYKTFLANKALIAEHNKKFENGEVTFTLGVNKYADLTLEETAFLRGQKRFAPRKSNAPVFQPKVGVTYPVTVDWRNSGYVTPVKDQGQCGSCWSFSATGSLEGQNFAKYGKLTSLSEQNLVDCVVGSSCNGGWYTDAFTYVKNNGGIDTEISYPYTAQNGLCHFDAAHVGGYCTGYTETTPHSEPDLLAAAATIGPISVAIDASHASFQLYKSGVYYEASCYENILDHAVLVVGYGTQNGLDYWLVKNSWGTSWGENGYIQMSRNRNNNCGIATQPAYPHV